MIARHFQGSFTIDSFLQSPQGLLNRLAFFQSNLGQLYSLPLRKTPEHAGALIRPTVRFKSGGGGYFEVSPVSNGKNASHRVPRRGRPHIFEHIGENLRS